MIRGPLSPVASHTVVRVLAAVLGHDRRALDSTYAFEFADNALQPREQGEVVAATGELLRRLSLFCSLAKLLPEGALAEEVAAAAAAEPEVLLHVWHQFHHLEPPDALDLPQDAPTLSRSSVQRARQRLALWDGCPPRLDAVCEGHLGAHAWTAERAALREPPRRFIRTNTFKTTRADLAEALALEGVRTKPVDRGGMEAVGAHNVDECALEVISDSALFRTRAFRQGLFEQQDAGSQMVSLAVDARAGMRVVDGCAGAGSKTLHLAQCMRGKGRLLALDVADWKLKALRQRARRAGAPNIETRPIVSKNTVKRLKRQADRVLVDAPCSGLGVLRRHPETKWQSPLGPLDRLDELLALQTHILQSHSRMVKVGGKLVYATCSILPCENREKVDWFLSQNPHFVLEADETLSPAATGWDGFYIAKMERTA